MTNIIHATPEEILEAIRKHSCRYCSGYGYTSEHDPNDPHHDGECSGSCPVQLPCEDCHAEGSYVTLDALREALSTLPRYDALKEETELEDRLVEAIKNEGILEDCYNGAIPADEETYNWLAATIRSVLKGGKP